MAVSCMLYGVISDPSMICIPGSNGVRIELRNNPKYQPIHAPHQRCRGEGQEIPRAATYAAEGPPQRRGRAGARHVIRQGTEAKACHGRPTDRAPLRRTTQIRRMRRIPCVWAGPKDGPIRPQGDLCHSSVWLGAGQKHGTPPTYHTFPTIPLPDVPKGGRAAGTGAGGIGRRDPEGYGMVRPGGGAPATYGGRPGSVVWDPPDPAAGGRAPARPNHTILVRTAPPEPARPARRAGLRDGPHRCRPPHPRRGRAPPPPRPPPGLVSAVPQGAGSVPGMRISAVPPHRTWTWHGPAGPYPNGHTHGIPAPRRALPPRRMVVRQGSVPCGWGPMGPRKKNRSSCAGSCPTCFRSCWHRRPRRRRRLCLAFLWPCGCR